MVPAPGADSMSRRPPASSALAHAHQPQAGAQTFDVEPNPVIPDRDLEGSVLRRQRHFEASVRVPGDVGQCLLRYTEAGGLDLERCPRIGRCGGETGVHAGALPKRSTRSRSAPTRPNSSSVDGRSSKAEIDEPTRIDGCSVFGKEIEDERDRCLKK